MGGTRGRNVFRSRAREERNGGGQGSRGPHPDRLLEECRLLFQERGGMIMRVFTARTNLRHNGERYAEGSLVTDKELGDHADALLESGAITVRGETPDGLFDMSDQEAYIETTRRLYEEIDGGALDHELHPENFDPETLVPTPEIFEELTGTGVTEEICHALWNGVAVHWWNGHEPWLNKADTDTGTDGKVDGDQVRLRLENAQPDNRLDISLHPDNFTGEGIPKTKVMEAILGRDITAGERDALWAEFKGE